MSLRDVRKLLDDRSLGEKAFEALGQLSDAVLIFSPAAVGPAGFALYALLDPKDRLVALCKNVIKAISKSDARDYLDQAENLAAANCLLTFTAYFEALDLYLPELAQALRLTDADKQHIAAARTTAVSLPDGQARTGDSDGHFVTRMIAVQHPAATPEAAADARMGIYQSLSSRLFARLRGPAFDEESEVQISEGEWLRVRADLLEKLPVSADRLYRAELVGLAIDFPQFLTWLTLFDQDAKDALIRKIGADTRVQFELVGRTVDLGLSGLATEMSQLRRAMAALGERVTDQPSNAELADVAEALHREYAYRIEQPVIDDRYDPAGGPRLGYPTRVQSYVPQAYRVATYQAADKAARHLERDDAWAGRSREDDLGQFVLRYLESAYSTRSPLLILGQPGSGKSLLTQILAAHLAYPAYTTVRVELRDANPNTDIQSQIEAQIRQDTGESISWTQFTRALPSPPVVILDGYDELLQATGSVYADYLDQVRLFQERESVQRRPVRVIVTSRITLIDKLVLPEGTTIVRLEEFDDARRQAWTEVWNSRNREYFADSGVRPFRLPERNQNITELAAQPLLLLMLALYDSAANELSRQPDIDRTRLYSELLTRFIRRELDKDASGFRKLTADEQQDCVDRELERLGVAAIGMFNRQSLSIRRDDLDRDLKYYDAEHDRPEAGLRPLTQAELLLGSFFFIHESRSEESASAGQATSGGAGETFEFLHKTFGEFLAADFILRQVSAQAEKIAALASNPKLAATLQRQLTQLDPAWFGCLVHTPLHTQPNVLFLLREWAGHRSGAKSLSKADLLASLDKIILTQLRALLTEPTLRALVSLDQAMPYHRLPALGHLAVYTLNLIVLRTYLAEAPPGLDDYVLDERDLGDQPGRVRPWDRLAAIWRSWFPAESLAALAAGFTATREAARITLQPYESTLLFSKTSPLSHAYDASIALADNLTAGSLGLHLMAGALMPDNYLEDLRGRVAAEAEDLTPALDFAESRISRRRPEDHPVFLTKYWRHNGNYEAVAPGLVPVTHEVEAAEMASLLLTSPRLRHEIFSMRPSVMGYFARLSRYAAQVAINFRLPLEPAWLPDLLERVEPSEWRDLLAGPAAVPLLLAAIEQLDNTQCAAAAEAMSEALPAAIDHFFDEATAASVAVLAWRGGSMRLCERALSIITLTCEQGYWDIQAIPELAWAGLADLLVASRRDGVPFGRELASLAGAEIQRLLWEIGVRLNSTQFDFLIQAMRITGNTPEEDVERVIELIFDSNEVLVSRRHRHWFLLLIRLTREKNDHRIVVLLFLYRLTRGRAGNRQDTLLWQRLLNVPAGRPLGTLELEQISSELTYREVIDLRWAVDVARQSMPGQVLVWSGARDRYVEGAPGPDV